MFFKCVFWTNLQKLYLDNNQIEEIPPQIASLTNLQKLYLYDNQINIIPDSIANSQLRELYLSNNQINIIPDSIAKSQLQILYLGYNQIKYISNLFMYNDNLFYYCKNYKIKKTWIYNFDKLNLLNNFHTYRNQAVTIIISLYHLPYEIIDNVLSYYINNIYANC